MHFDASVRLMARSVSKKGFQLLFKSQYFLPFSDFLASLMEEKVQQNIAVELYGDYFTEVIFN